jgi:hypothetical protein
LLGAGITVLAALAAPAAASAHPRGPAIALDDRATVAPAPAPGVTAAILDGDRKLRLTVGAGVRLVVLGYLGEPVLRFAGGTVAVDDRSPTAQTDGLVPKGASGWTTVARGRSFAWHDHRVAPKLPPGIARLSWSIPVLVDGRRDRIRGSLVHVRKPQLWPWLVLAGALLALGGGVALAHRRRLSVRAGVAIAVLGGAAGLTSLAGFSIAGVAGGAAVAELSAAAALAVGATVALVLSRRRLAVAGAIGALAAIEGLGRLGVFVHGVVISELPAAAARAADAVAIGAGLAAILIALTQPAPQPRRRPR